MLKIMFGRCTFALSRSHTDSIVCLRRKCTREAQLILPKINTTVNSMSYRQMSRIPSSYHVRNKFKPQHRLDGVSSHFSLVYVNNLKDWIGFSRLGITVTLLLSMPVGFYHFEKVMSLDANNQLILTAISLLLIPSFIVPNILARSLFKRIYYNPTTCHFVGVQRTFMGRVKQTEYNVDDIQFVRKHEQTDSTDYASVFIKDRKYHFSSADFVSPEFYNMHIGVIRQPRGAKFEGTMF